MKYIAVYTDHSMMHFLSLFDNIFISLQECASRRQSTPAGTCGDVVGGPDFSFDMGLIVQLAQQLFHSPTSGISIAPTVGVRQV